MWELPLTEPMKENDTAILIFLTSFFLSLLYITNAKLLIKYQYC